MRQFFLNACLAAALAGGSLLYAAEPYDSIRLVSYEPYFFENSWILLNAVNSQNASVFIDVESSEGMAARFIAANTSEVHVYNINTWNENEHQFQQFLSNVVEENTQESITPIRMSSREASNALNLISELIYIDSTQSEAVYDKILSWVTHLTQNGVIAGNHWEWHEVELAVVQAAGDLGLTLNIDGNFWFLRKIN